MTGVDPDFDRYRELLRAQDWRVLSKRLVAFALHKGRRYVKGWNRDDAWDAVQEVIRWLFEPATRPWWNPATQPDLYLFLLGRVTRQVKAAFARVLRFPRRTEEELEEIGPTAPSHEEGLAREQLAAKRLARLKELHFDDPDALLVIACLEEGLDDVQETADRSGISWNAVYNARRRIEGKLVQVKREIPGGEES